MFSLIWFTACWCDGISLTATLLDCQNLLKTFSFMDPILLHTICYIFGYICCTLVCVVFQSFCDVVGMLDITDSVFEHIPTLSHSICYIWLHLPYIGLCSIWVSVGMLDITDSVFEHIICYGYICRTLVCVVVESLSECWILLTAFLSTSYVMVTFAVHWSVSYLSRCRNAGYYWQRFWAHHMLWLHLPYIGLCRSWVIVGMLDITDSVSEHIPTLSHSICYIWLHLLYVGLCRSWVIVGMLDITDSVSEHIPTLSHSICYIWLHLLYVGLCRSWVIVGMLDITDSVFEHIICYGYICCTLVCVVVESLSECWILLTAFLSTSPPCRAPYVGFGDIIDCTLALRRIAAKPKRQGTDQYTGEAARFCEK